MSKKILRSFSIVVVVLIISSSFVFADVIHLKSGGKLEGKIVKQDANSLTLKVSYGEITVKKNEIASITYGEVEPPVVKPRVVKPPKLSKGGEEKKIKDYFVRVCEINYDLYSIYTKFYQTPFEREYPPVFRSGWYDDQAYVGGKHSYFRDQWYLDRVKEAKECYKKLKEMSPPPKLKTFHYYFLRGSKALIEGLVSSSEGGEGLEGQDSWYETERFQKQLRRLNLLELWHATRDKVTQRKIEEEIETRRKEKKTFIRIKKRRGE